MSATPSDPLAPLFAPFQSGVPAGNSADWYRRLWELATVRSDRAFWARAATESARLLLPYYERAFRDDPRPRVGIEAAEALTDDSSPAVRARAEGHRVQVGAIRCGDGLAGAVVTVARWALQTALATHAAPRGEFPPSLTPWGAATWNTTTSRDETDWTYCGLMALTNTADALAAAVRGERKGWPPKWTVAFDEGKHRVLALLRDMIGTPLRPVWFSSDWRTDTAVSLARTMYEAHEFSAMPILADALQDAGCDNEEILDHCRDASATHVRGCWVIDLVLGTG
jgi:hypothetical protein